MWLHHRDLRKSDPLKLSTQPLAQQKFPCQKSLTPSFFNRVSMAQPKCGLAKHPRRVISTAPTTPASRCPLPSLEYRHRIRDTRIRTSSRWDKTRSYSQSSTSGIEGLSQLMCFTLGSRPSPLRQDPTDPVRR